MRAVAFSASRRLERGDLGRQLRIEPLGDVDVLVQPAHRVPEVLLLHVQRDVVLAQLVLAVAQRVEDAVEVALRRLVLAEVVADAVAERDHPEDLLASARLAGVEVLHGAAQVEKGLADLAGLAQPALLERLDRRLEQPVAGLGGPADVVVAHGAHIGRLGVEGRRLGLRGEQRTQVALDLRVEARDGGCGDLRGHLRRRRLVDRLHGGGWFQGQYRRGAGRRCQRLYGLRGRRRCRGGGAGGRLVRHGAGLPFAGLDTGYAVARRAPVVRAHPRCADEPPIYAVPGPGKRPVLP